MTSGQPLTEPERRRVVRLLARLGNCSAVAYHTGLHRTTVHEAGLWAWGDLVRRWEEEGKHHELEDLASRE